MPLILDTGISTHKGRRDSNHDACLVAAHNLPIENLALLAIADALEESSEEESAASSAVNTFKDSFFSAPENWDMDRHIQESFTVVNRSLSTASIAGRASTLSALIINGNSWVTGHAGNTRIWLLRDTKLKLLTRDHIDPTIRGPVVNRACGKSSDIETEISKGEILENDVFILTTDGAHDVLDGSMLLGCLMKGKTSQEIADDITKLAYDKGSHDNLSACVVKIENLPSQSETTSVKPATALPVIDLPENGATIDHYHISGMIYKGRTSVIYKAVDQKTGDKISLKFPNPKYSDSPRFVELFLNEEWMGKRLDHPYLMKALPITPGRRTALYSPMEYRPGENLEKRIKRKTRLSLRESLHLARQLLECLHYLHDKGVIHQDLNPRNILVDKKNKRLLLATFGVFTLSKLKSASAGASDSSDISFTAPEVLQGRSPDKRADIYAAGVTLYKMLTGKYPYGKLRSLEELMQREYRPVEHYNEHVPPWLALVIKKACSVHPESRYRHAMMFLEEIDYFPEREEPKKRGIADLLKNNWQIFLIGLLAINLIVVMMWLLG